MCGVSNYSVSVYLSPLQIPVLELEDGEGMCRLEVGGRRGEGRGGEGKMWRNSPNPPSSPPPLAR